MGVWGMGAGKGEEVTKTKQNKKGNENKSKNKITPYHDGHYVKRTYQLKAPNGQNI